MLVRVLLCTLYPACFGPDQWPSSGDLHHKIYLKAVTNISMDPLSQIYKRANAIVTKTRCGIKMLKYLNQYLKIELKELNTINLMFRYLIDTRATGCIPQ
jgi:hypothetical protein